MLASKPTDPLEPLRRSLASLRKGDRIAALEALLEAWRSTGRVPELAELCEVLGATVDAALPPVSAAGHSSLQQGWIARLEGARQSAELGPLYAILIDTRPTLAQVRLAMLRDRPADPRLAALLAHCLREIPFRGPGGRGFFIEAIRQLGAIDDPRFHDELRATATALAARTVVGLRRVGQAAVKPLVVLGRELEGRTPPAQLSEGARELCDAIRVALRPGAREQGSLETGDDLLAAVHASPEDDAPRLVYSDWLQTRGDPRGELIALQCARHATGETPTRREQTLLKQYGEAWLGALAPFVLKSGREYRRGFLAACRFKDEKIGRHPERLAAWATVEEIDFSAHVFVSGAPELISSPNLRGLRVVRGLGGDDLLKLCKHRGPLPLRSLQLRHGDLRALVPALASARDLPELRELDLSEASGGSPELAQQLRESALGRRLERLVFPESDD